MKRVGSTSLWFSFLALSVALFSGCSSESEEPAGGGAGESGSGGASATGGSSATGGGEAGGGMGGTTEAPGEPNAPVCVSARAIKAGQNYGDYTVYSVRLAPGIEPGEYTVRVHSGDSGLAYVYRDEVLVESFDYQPEAPLTVGQSETIEFPELFELDLRSTAQSDLAALDQSIFDGCHVVSVTAPGKLEQGGVYDAYEVIALSVDAAAPAGTYTLFVSTGNTGEVQLLRDGTVVDTLTYAWTTTIGGEASFEFVFPGVLSFTVDRVMGTSNLFGLGDALFDGRHELVVE